jgi:hypothetical protein
MSCGAYEHLYIPPKDPVNNFGEIKNNKFHKRLLDWWWSTKTLGAETCKN